jgi:hypothetical protein
MHAVRIIRTIQLVRVFRLDVVFVEGRRKFVGSEEIIVEKDGRWLAWKKSAKTRRDDEKVYWNEVTGPV